MKANELNFHKISTLGYLIFSIILWMSSSINHPIWPATKYALLVISIIFCGFHAFHSIRILRQKTKKNYDQVKRMLFINNTTWMLQKASLVGLAIIIIGLFMAKDPILIGTGIGILFLFGIEYFSFSWIGWNLEEDIRRKIKD